MGLKFNPALIFCINYALALYSAMEKTAENKQPLISEAMHGQLQHAAAHNHTELFKQNAVNNGGEVCTKDGVTWTYDRVKGGNIAFPQLVKENATNLLDEITDYYRALKETNIGCWSLHPLPYRALGVKLLARGFQPGWKPNWMAIDLAHINIGYPIPPGLEIHPDNTTDTRPLTNLPYSGDRGAVGEAHEPIGGLSRVPAPVNRSPSADPQ